MSRSLNSPEYHALRALLVAAREQAELTQADVATRLRRAQSFVSKYEVGERRLDVIDFVRVCEALSVDPADLLRQVTKARRK